MPGWEDSEVNEGGPGSLKANNSVGVGGCERIRYSGPAGCTRSCGAN